MSLPVSISEHRSSRVLLNDSVKTVKHRHTLAPVSTAKLVARHPNLLSRGTLSHPRKLTRLLHNSEVGPLRAFCDACPRDCIDKTLPQLLDNLDRDTIKCVLAPLLNTPELHDALVAMLTRIDARVLTEVLNGAPLDSLGVLLRAPCDSLTALVSAVSAERIQAMLVPVIRNPSAVLDMVAASHHPERAGAVVNYVDPEVLVWLLEGVEGSRIAEIMDAFEPHDFEAKGTFISFLRELEDERRLSREKVAPFCAIVEPAVLAQLVQGVSADKLLEVLRRVGAEGVARLLRSTNVELIIRLWNGPLENIVTHCAGSLSDMQRNPTAAAAVKTTTDSVNAGYTAVLKKGSRGRGLRGSRTKSSYRLGDFGRGLMADLTDAISKLDCCTQITHTDSDITPLNK